MNLPQSRQRPLTTLELLVLRRGSQWESLGHYSIEERNDAIEEAKRLETCGDVFCAKVVKETFNPDENTSVQTTIFRSSTAFREDTENLIGARRKRLDGISKKRQNIFSADTSSILGFFFRGLHTLFNIPQSPNSNASRKQKARTKPQNNISKKILPKSGNLPNKELPIAENNKLPWCAHLDIVNKFLVDAKSYINHINSSSNNVARFGICFFICGACEALSKQTPLSREDSVSLVAESLSVLRLSKDRARHFAERCENYLAESVRYMEMFQAGHNAMVAFVRDSVSSASSLQAALKTWNERKDRKQSRTRRSVTLMFTDIVGASAMAAERGDDHAMKVLRVHNQIVDSVLAQFRGIHVKNTGDGVLAAFEHARMAVKAGCVIQRCIKEHNASFPSHELQLRIGLNVGEAIAESGDFFGAAVNLASRVCAAAGPHQVFCTGIVRRRAEQPGIPFVARGQYQMKGYREPIPLFEVVWDDRPAAESQALATDRIFEEDASKAVKLTQQVVEA